jgi:hypothetical protein
MFGAQYLHTPIPGLTDGQEPVKISYKLLGSVEDYRRKVYGKRPIEVSPESLEGEHEAWDIRRAYHRAWQMYGQDVVPIPDITPEFLGLLRWRRGGPEVQPANVLQVGRYDLILSTIPANRLCYHQDEHSFPSQIVWAIGDAPERGIFCPIRSAPDNTVICSGERDTGWYRVSNVFGYFTAEWPEGKRPPISNVAPVEKPIGTDCDCFLTCWKDTRFIRAGRYGPWTKGYLSHHAYETAVRL